MLCVNPLVRTLLTSLFLLCNFGSPSEAQIDLHAHLHMKPGMGPMISGTFNDPPRANRWSDRFQMRASGALLAGMTAESRPKMIVLSLYGHPYFAWSFERDGFAFNRKAIARQAVEREYAEFMQFLNQHQDRYAIAKNASQARKIIRSGKTAIVLSIEGAWGHLESADDFQKWIDERGVAIITPVHLTPDDFGGNALMSPLISLANSTLDFLKSVWLSNGKCLKTFCKSQQGFTEEGQQLIDDLISREVWIDLAHMNELEVNHVLPKLLSGKAGKPLPLLSTHTQLRKFYPVERGLGDAEIEYIRKQDGIIGLIPSQHMMPAGMKQAHEDALVAHPEEAEAASAAKGLSCITGLEVFKKTVHYAIAALGAPERVALASDINAPLDGLSPGCADVSKMEESMRDLNRRGFYTYAQWNTLVKYSAPDTQWSERNLEHFLTLWERVRPSK